MRKYLNFLNFLLRTIHIVNENVGDCPLAEN